MNPADDVIAVLILRIGCRRGRQYFTRLQIRKMQHHGSRSNIHRRAVQMAMIAFLDANQFPSFHLASPDKAQYRRGLSIIPSIR
jgi:hypothetical protein